MDIVLERILSLIPKKQDGSFVHGACKEFAVSIGLKSGNLISDWIKGRSKSYTGYIYKIASVYNVSVDWLEGKTDEKIPLADLINSEGDPVKEEMYHMMSTATQEELRDMLELMRFVKRKRKDG